MTTRSQHARSATLRNWLLRKAAICCLVSGAILLGACVFVWAGAHVYQALQDQRFAWDVSASAGFSKTPAVPRILETALHNSLAAPLGKLEVPRIGLSVVILEGVDDGTLRIAAGHVPDTALPGQPGNVAIAGHRDTMFRPLQNIRENDTITLETVNGTFQYRVKGMWIVAPEQVEVLDPTTDPSLTLVTCYPFHYVGAAPYRFIVRAQQTTPRPTILAKTGDRLRRVRPAEPAQLPGDSHLVSSSQ